MITSTASCRRCARLTAALSKAATESVAETMRTLSRPAERAGKEMPTIRPTIARTTTMSTRVMPRRFLLALPTDDIGIDSFAAGLAVGAEADDIRLVVSVLAGETVHVVHAPRILRNVQRHVGAIPLGSI